MRRGKTTFEFADRGKGRLHFPYVVLPNIDGINMLFGDGHVKWKKKSEFLHLSKMYLWSRYPDGAIAHGDSFYY